jgi:GTP-binding protein Era
LLNALLGQKLAITNPKPQTTRRRICGILSEPAYQVIFLDTPGLIAPQYLLQEKMMREVTSSAADADALVLLVDITQEKDIEEIFSGAFRTVYPKIDDMSLILAFNKADLLSPIAVDEIIQKISSRTNIARVITVSALQGANISRLLETIVSLLPVHPKYYPDEIVSDLQERFFVTEIIREKILELYQDEIPYSCEVTIEQFTEREGQKHYIGALIFVERDSQKGIIIGKKGAALKAVGAAARKDIETFLDHPVYLELHVKVKNEWRRDPNALKEFGYERGDD